MKIKSVVYILSLVIIVLFVYGCTGGGEGVVALSSDEETQTSLSEEEATELILTAKETAAKSYLIGRQSAETTTRAQLPKSQELLIDDDSESPTPADTFPDKVLPAPEPDRNEGKGCYAWLFILKGNVDALQEDRHYDQIQYAHLCLEPFTPSSTKLTDNKNVHIHFDDLAISPNGEKISYTVIDTQNYPSSSELRVGSVLSPDPENTRTNSHLEFAGPATFNPNGTSFAYIKGNVIYRYNVNLQGEPEELVRNMEDGSRIFVGSASWHPIDNFIVYSGQKSSETDHKIYALDLETGQSVGVYKITPITENLVGGSLSLSPDGEQLLYKNGNELRMCDIYFNGAIGEQLIHVCTNDKKVVEDAYNAKFTHDKKYIVYNSQDALGKWNIYRIKVDSLEIEDLTFWSGSIDPIPLPPTFSLSPPRPSTSPSPLPALE